MERDYLSILDAECDELFGPTPSQLGKQYGVDFLSKPTVVSDWLVKDLLPAQTMTMMYGDGGTYKSWFAQSLAVSLAAGRPAFGIYEIQKPRTVVYVQTESSESALQKRFRSICQGYGLEPKHVGKQLIVLTNTGFQLDSDRDIDLLTENLIRVDKPDLIIFDPLIDLHSKEENSATEMRPIAMSLRKMRDEHGVSSLVLHHTNKNPNQTGSGRARGSTALRNWMDGRWHIEKVPNSDWVKFSELYYKEHEPGRLFRFRPLIDPEGTLVEHEWLDEGSTSQTQKNWGRTNLTRVAKELQRFGVRELRERTQLNDTPTRALIRKMVNWKIIREVEPEPTGKTTRKMWEVI